MPARVISHDGALQLLAESLANGEDWLLCLFTSPLVPAEGDTAATYTPHEASFAGYGRKTLKRAVGPAAWSVPILKAPSGVPPWTAKAQVAYSQYPTQAWATTGSTDVVTGYFVLGATSGRLLWAEAWDFPAPMLAPGSTLAFSPSHEEA